MKLTSLKAENFRYYKQLMRTDKPIGILLLLWPTYWALWIASAGIPSIKNLLIFSLGVFVMRSAGCVINDYADRKIDGSVERTAKRPLATGQVASSEALSLFVLLILIAFGLVLMLDWATILLSFGALALAFCYPFMKRFTHLPQVFLGAAFSWAIPMAFMAASGELPMVTWVLFLANVIWTVSYDTMYAMVDKKDDLKIGVKSTAILFADADRIIIFLLNSAFIALLAWVGYLETLSTTYWLGLVTACGFFIYQQYLIHHRQRAECFKAFLNNHYVGMVIFIGLVAALPLSL